MSVTGTYNGHEYTILTVQRPFTEQRDECHDLDGELAVVTSEGEDDFIRNLAMYIMSISIWEDIFS